MRGFFNNYPVLLTHAHKEPLFFLPLPSRERTEVRGFIAINKIAQTLRKNQTPAEYVLWGCLRNRQLLGLKFRRQQPVDKHIVDFVCFENKVIIEVDGSQHLLNEKRYVRRTKILEQNGFHVLRFTNDEVIHELNGVIENIVDFCQQHP